jgi:AcrR family transcriptional regulator
VRFLAQGYEETSAEEIATDAGVTLRTFYRHFASKRELLFEDYDASLQWFRSALETRPPGETITQAVLTAINSFQAPSLPSRRCPITTPSSSGQVTTV